jgi:hypothetical protein
VTRPRTGTATRWRAVRPRCRARTSGSSPSIASVGTAWTIAFQANTGSLYYRDGNSAAVDTGYGMMAGTNPGI